ncbi:Nitrate transporter [Granulibacter bethesdensis CGDNIH1]|uniref:Nitrate transporter n=2 Tax=Granulibacter bethesdensis TaxID=364410 RepID=Q0BRC6_GRABC|nr:Nitrate transporter [Granulibacter bethesdensis CGDNIH1]APH52481.1 Nitrate transporter [Granulibacter bethesdensis]APH65170.1 Nitrate transporter [Granulibacter bethesdensis]
MESQMTNGTASLLPAEPRDGASRALWMSTFAFTICFAVWTIFAIIGVKIRQELHLTETQFGLLLGTPILTGSLSRLLLGIWASRWGGRAVYVAVMLTAAVATLLLSFAHSYETMLLAGLGIGIAGGSFAVGVSYVSPFFSQMKQGTALGIFGAGNVGAAVTKLLAPLVVAGWGWRAVPPVWAVALVLTAGAFWFLTSDEPQRAQRRGRFRDEFAPLRHVQVWRFSLYYFFAFGGFVALALWLPRYLVGVYGMDLETAGLVAACYSIPGSVFRAYGGILSDRIGARRVLYAMFGVAALATLILSFPAHAGGGVAGIGPVIFVIVAFVLGFVMSLGKAAVYKHVPSYYPDSVGAVGGIVGLIGGLGGFIFPIIFGFLKDQTGSWQSCFMLLFVVVLVSMIWMHAAIRAMRRQSMILQAAQ